MKNVEKLNLSRPTVGVPISGSRTRVVCERCKEYTYRYFQESKTSVVNGFECTHWEVNCTCPSCGHVIQTEEQQKYNQKQVEKLADTTATQRQIRNSEKRTRWFVGALMGGLMLAITAVQVYSSFIA